MPFSVNKQTLVGRLGADAETTTIGENRTVTKFSVVTEHSHKDSNGEWTNIPTWHNVVAFNLNNYLEGTLKKGAQVFVEGRTSNRSYEVDGQKRYITEVVTDFNGIVPLDSSRSGNSNGNTGGTGAANVPDENIGDDDLPF